MGYPSSSRRMGDKKRYYYSNNPNRRHSSQMLYSKKTYPPASGPSHNYPPESPSYANSIERTTTPTTQTSMGSHTISAPGTPVQPSGQGKDLRTSRYDPSPIGRPPSGPHKQLSNAPRKPTSRYNPDIENPTTASPQKTDTVDLPRSRYSGSSLSRYNSQNSIGSYSHTNGEPHAPQPLSMKNALKNKSPRISDTNTFVNDYPTSTYKPSGPANPNSTASYFNRANKWRMGSSVDTKLDHDYPPLGRSIATAPTAPSPRNRYWKTGSSKYANGIPHQPNIHDTVGFQRSSSNSISTNSNYERSHSYSAETQEHDRGRQARNSYDHNYSRDVDQQREKSPIGSPNPHSLGSSLINSVSQTTRETEAKLLKEKQLKDDTHIHTKRPNLPSNTIVKKHDNGEDSKKNERPEINTLWTSNDDIFAENDIEKAKGQGREQEKEMESKIITGNETTNKNELKNVQDSEVGKEKGSNNEKVNDNNSSEMEEIENEQEEEDLEMDDDVTAIDEQRVFKENRPSDMLDYEYIYDPKDLRTDFSKIDMSPKEIPYSEPLEPINSCIFPMNRTETRLWQIKNQSRTEIIKNQKYLLKKPIKNIKVYPFFKKNLVIHEQAIRYDLARAISKLKKHDKVGVLNLKKDYLDHIENWKHQCEVSSEISKSLRKKEIAYYEKVDKEIQEREEQEKLQEEQQRQNNSSRRRNRADFVDDAEMETVLLQIDPDYKFHQAAASIPPMITTTLEKHSYKFADVNNLVTDKNEWASRVLTDGIDNFTEHEHELFVEGYLMNPKKFSRISNFMGGLRTPEECVLHYYRTKRAVDYKTLVNERNKKRKGVANKKKKKKERSSDLESDQKVEKSVEDKTDVSVAESLPNTESELAKEVENIEKEQDTKLEIAPTPVEIEIPASDKTKEEEMLQDANNTQIEPITNIETPERHHISNFEEKEEEEEARHVAIEVQRQMTENEHSYTPQFENHIHAGLDKSPKDRSHEFATILPRPDLNTSTEIGYEDGNARKRHKQAQDHRSSYWSVKETQLFPDLLKEFGSQWSLISEKLATKSTTMVRNYYQRNAAQFGWKALVEDADAKRNATSSGLVQQSQILLPPEQPVFNLVSGQSRARSNAGYFGDNEQVTEDINSHPFGPETGRDSFSKVTTPTGALPPPRLPSIQFQNGANTNPPSLHQLKGISPVENITGVREEHRNNSINSILNVSGGSESVHGHDDIAAPTPTAAAAAAAPPPAPPSAATAPTPASAIAPFSSTAPTPGPALAPITVAAPVAEVTSKIRSSSISSLLNPASHQTKPNIGTGGGNSTSPPPIHQFIGGNMPTPCIFSDRLTLHPLPPVGNSAVPQLPIIPQQQSPPLASPTVQSDTSHSSNNVPTQQQEQKMPMLNFANDPLAALAAIASAPDTMASLLPQEKK
ncbi:Snt1p [Nakaseomyces bracarensis]|uniref:Snt1p n=1 Tax=Nakaseomyces bracarensis TaxID=273131 RepID=UPI0038719DD2